LCILKINNKNGVKKGVNFLKFTTEIAEFAAMPEAGPCPRQAGASGGKFQKKIKLTVRFTQSGER
jgi:hypothetical protein